MSKRETPGIGYEEMSGLLDVKANSLRQRVKRGKFPSPEIGAGKEKLWSIPQIVKIIDSGVLGDSWVVPPHWREWDESRPARFLGVRGDADGHPVIAFEHRGLTVGLAPGRFDGPRANVQRFTDKGNNPVCDFLYAESAEPTGVVTLLPSLSATPRPGLLVPFVPESGVGSADQNDDGYYQKVWHRLSKVLGMPLPHWPSRFFRVEDIWSWTPGREEPNVVTPLPHDELKYNALSAIELFVEDEYLEIVRRKKEQEIKTGVRLDSEVYISGEWRSSISIPVTTDVDEDVEPVQNFSRAIENVSLRPGSPTRSSLLVDAAHHLTYRRSAPYSTVVGEDVPEIPAALADRFRRTKSDLARMMLDSPSEPDPDFARTVLGVAAGGDQHDWRILDGSDARVAESDGKVFFVPPRFIEGIGKVVEVSHPGIDDKNYPLICDERGRVWPMPLGGFSASGSYISGYDGGSPPDFTAAVVACLGHNGYLDSDEMRPDEARKVDVPEIGKVSRNSIWHAFGERSRGRNEVLTRQELLAMLSSIKGSDPLSMYGYE